MAENKINIGDIAKTLRERGIGNSNKDNEIIIKGVVDIIKDSLVEGKDVSIFGLGTFSVKDVEERAGRNIQTGEAITIPAHKAPKFKFSQTVKDVVK